MAGRRKVARILVLVAVLFAVCWMPYHLLSLFIDFVHNVHSTKALDFLPFTILIGKYRFFVFIYILSKWSLFYMYDIWPHLLRVQSHFSQDKCAMSYNPCFLKYCQLVSCVLGNRVFCSYTTIKCT